MAASLAQIPSTEGKPLETVLHVPPARPEAGVLIVHCFPPDACHALQHISTAMVDRGWAVLTLDFAEIAAPGDVVAAAAWLQQRFGVPLLLVGHSLGGTLLLATAKQIGDAQGVVTINAPAGVGGYTRKADAPGNALNLVGRIVERRSAVDAALDWGRLQQQIEHLRRPLLIMHAPLDNFVELPNAASLFTAAKHPKSFISLDGGDHLLSRSAAAQYSAEVLGAWAARYLRRELREVEHDTHVIVAEAGNGRFRQHVLAGHHRALADEPPAVGGNDAGPSPYELLLAALGACTAMTLRMYAGHKELPLEHVSVELRHGKVHADACKECETREGKIDRIERVITLEGDLDHEQRQRLLEIANKCPVHRTLHSEVWVPTRLAE